MAKCSYYSIDNDGNEHWTEWEDGRSDDEFKADVLKMIEAITDWGDGFERQRRYRERIKANGRTSHNG